MPVLTDAQAQALAGGIQSVGGVQNYGGGNGQAAPHDAKFAPGTLKLNNAPHQNFIQKIAAIGTQGGKIVGKGALAVGKFAVHTAQDIAGEVKLGANTATHIITDPIKLKAATDITNQLSKQQAVLAEAYKSGKMSKDNYVKASQETAKALQEINKKTTASIVNGPTAVQRGVNVAELGADILTLGRVTAVKSLTKQGVKVTTSEVVDGGLSRVTKGIEELVTKVPAMRALVERNAAALAKPLAGETFDQQILRQGKQVAFGLLIKRPIFVQQNVTGVKDVYQDILSGDYGGALKMSAFLATQLLEGGPIGAFLRGGKWVKGELRQLSYGTASLVDNLSREIGDKTPGQIADYLVSLDRNSSDFKDAEKVFRIMQETNLRVADEDVSEAVRNILSTYDHAGIPRELITPAKLVQDYSRWHEAAQITSDLAHRSIKGLTAEERRNLVVVRWDSMMKRGLANAISQAGDDRKAMSQVLTHFAEETSNGWSNNPTLMAQLIKIVDRASTAEEAAGKIKAIPTAFAIPDNIPKAAAKRLAELGYGVAVPQGGRRKTPLLDYDDTRKLISSATAKDATDELFDAANAPVPILGTVASGLEKAGLSPRSASKVASRSLAESVTAELQVTGVAAGLGFKQGGQMVKGGQVILSKLQQYVNEQKASTLGKVITLGKARPALTDIRQLTNKEIRDTLHITSGEAREVSKAIMKGYTDVPLEYRGLGDKIVDYAFRVNPLQKFYSRIQSGLRYSYNPFFAAQEGVETSVFAGLSGGNRATNLASNHLLWNKSREELNLAVKTLDDAQIFSSSLAGEAAQDQVLGRLTADITDAQKRDLAGLALDLAKRQGKDLDTLARENPDQIADALRIIVQYPQKGFLASPLARTLNVAFFPMRYNVKVVQMSAEILSKQPPSVQLATIHSLMNLNDWLKSDEGIRWQSANADAIQVFNWISPLNNIGTALSLMHWQKPQSISSVGQLGGLPFGIISQVLDSQGLINLNTPYVNPKTGDVFPKYIPETTKARAATAFSDLLGSMFTYPGRILGLPGKQQTLNELTRHVINTKGSEFDKQAQDSRLTPLEQNWVRVLKGDHSQDAVDSLYNSPAPGQFNWYTMPPLNLPYIIPEKSPVLTRTEVANAKKAAKGGSGKKAKNYAKPVGEL